MLGVLGKIMENLDADWAFAQYERIRHLLPAADFARDWQVAGRMEEIADRFDVFLLDAFGVLNVGLTVIPGAPEWVRGLQKAGKKVLVVANGSYISPAASLLRFRNMGFDFALEDVIASRNVLGKTLGGRKEKLFGVMLSSNGGIEEIGARTVRLGDDGSDYDRVEGFILLGSGEWKQNRQELLVASLKQNPRPVLVGNPDIVAPRENGFSLEPGWFAHDIRERCGIEPEFFGKPFANIYEEAMQRVDPKVARDRIVMVGDTLHTDVWGGAAMGAKTVLMADYGLFAGLDVRPYIRSSGIVPDWIMTARGF